MTRPNPDVAGMVAPWVKASIINGENSTVLFEGKALFAVRGRCSEDIDQKGSLLSGVDAIIFKFKLEGISLEIARHAAFGCVQMVFEFNPELVISGVFWIVTMQDGIVHLASAGPVTVGLNPGDV
jgi:hypothetical protein